MTSTFQRLKHWFGVELIAVSFWERLVASLGGMTGIAGLTLILHWQAPD